MDIRDLFIRLRHADRVTRSNRKSRNAGEVVYLSAGLSIGKNRIQQRRLGLAAPLPPNNTFDPRRPQATQVHRATAGKCSIPLRLNREEALGDSRACAPDRLGSIVKDALRPVPFVRRLPRTARPVSPSDQGQPTDWPATDRPRPRQELRLRRRRRAKTQMRNDCAFGALRFVAQSGQADSFISVMRYNLSLCS